MARKLQCTVLALFLAFGAFAQKQLKGTVKSAESGENLPGVNVVVKGTTTGTVTDFDGNFSLTVPDNANTLVFSYLGFKTVTQPIDRIMFTINMENDAMGLDEVVVTSLGVSKEKKALGYAVEEVSAEELTRNNNSNIINSMSGKVAGVQVTGSNGSPGSASTIRIRGNASITGNNDPLFVVDGLPIDNSFNSTGNPDNGVNNLGAGVDLSNRTVDINPDDVASMTVLKGAAATALYGIRAANGAIIITTKKGQGGSLKAPKINYTTSLTVDRVNKMHRLQDQFSQGVGGQYRGPSTRTGGSWGANLDTLYYDPSTNNPWDKNGAIVGVSNPNKGNKVTPYDNVGDFFQDGYTQNNTVSLQGSSEKTNYYVSLGRMDQSGIVPNNDFSRTSVRVNAGTQITNRLKSTVSAGYSNSGGLRVQKGSNTSGIMLGLLRTPASFDNSNGFGPDAVNEPSAYTFDDGSQRTYRGTGIYDNPYWTINKNQFRDDVNRFTGQLQFDYNIAPWLNAQWRLGNDFYSDRRNQSFEIGSATLTGGQVFEDQIFNRDLNSDLLLLGNHQVNPDLETSFTLGLNNYSTNNQRFYVQGDDLALVNFPHLSNASSILSRNLISRKQTAAVYGEASVAFQRTYYATVTARNEWSSTLPSDNNSFLSTSASLGFIFTEALGLTDNKILPFGKLRLSYGVVGNDAPVYATRDYFTQASYNDGWTNGVSYPFNGVSGFYSNGVLGNSEIVPEKTTSFEIGTDLRFLNNAVGLDLTYYRNIGEDQIIPVSVSSSSGYRQAVLNAGRIKNSGIEALLSLTPIQTKDFTWGIDINFTKNESIVEELPEGVETITLNGFGGAQVRVVAGEPYGQIYGLGWMKNEDGRTLIDSNGYPILDPNERVIGNPNPDWTAGITNTITYKNLSISGLLDIRQGGDIWNGTRGVLYHFGRHIDTENRGETKIFDGVQSSGEENTIAVTLDEGWYTGLGSGFGPQAEQFVEDGSWIRLREVAISYKMPETWFNNTIIKGANISIIGKNLLLFTDYDGIDPETNLFGAINGPGLEYFGNPNTKSIGANLKVSL